MSGERVALPEVGQLAKVIAGPERGRTGTVTRVYPHGVFAGLVILDQNVPVEAGDLRILTSGEVANPGWAYRDANGRELMGPCHVPGCTGISLPGGGDNHPAHTR